jgi:hypothetical protein
MVLRFVVCCALPSLNELWLCSVSRIRLAWLLDVWCPSGLKAALGRDQGVALAQHQLFACNTWDHQHDHAKLSRALATPGIISMIMPSCHVRNEFLPISTELGLGSNMWPKCPSLVPVHMGMLLEGVWLDATKICKLIKCEFVSILINPFAIIPVFNSTSHDFCALANSLIYPWQNSARSSAWWAIASDGLLDAVRSKGSTFGCWLEGLPLFGFAFCGRSAFFGSPRFLLILKQLRRIFCFSLGFANIVIWSFCILGKGIAGGDAVRRPRRFGTKWHGWSKRGGPKCSYERLKCPCWSQEWCSTIVDIAVVGRQCAPRGTERNQDKHKHEEKGGSGLGDQEERGIRNRRFRFGVQLVEWDASTKSRSFSHRTNTQNPFTFVNIALFSQWPY